MLLVNAWVVDDAYITFRTVDNFVHGYGLTWNVAERLQAYTHPLWMLVTSAASLVAATLQMSSSTHADLARPRGRGSKSPQNEYDTPARRA